MSRRAYRAWVVRWEWAGEHAAPAGPKLVAILPRRWSSERVLQFVEILYAQAMFEPDEMLEAVRQGGRNPYPASFGTIPVPAAGPIEAVPFLGVITCGHNPWMYATPATVWPVADGSGQVRWTDDKLPFGDVD